MRKRLILGLCALSLAVVAPALAAAPPADTPTFPAPPPAPPPTAKPGAPAKVAAPSPGPAAPAAAPTGDAAKIDSLQQRLLASQQTIATLERELAAAKNRAVVMEECRVKNGRLVFIGRELIEGYEKRYKPLHRDPLQLGRRRFEFELQALSDAVYNNRVEVPVAVPPVPGEKRPADAAESPKSRKKSGKSKPVDAAPAAPVAAPSPNPTPAKPEEAH